MSVPYEEAHIPHTPAGTVVYEGASYRYDGSTVIVRHAGVGHVWVDYRLGSGHSMIPRDAFERDAVLQEPYVRP